MIQPNPHTHFNFQGPNFAHPLYHPSSFHTMPLFSASLGSVSGLAFFSHLLTNDNTIQTHYSSVSVLTNPPLNFPNLSLSSSLKRFSFYTSKVSVSSGSTKTEGVEEGGDERAIEDYPGDLRQTRRSADWKAARDYYERQLAYKGRIEGFNGGGLLIRFNSLVGFLPFPHLSPMYSCKEPQKTIHEIARALTGSLISVKVIQVDEEKRNLIFSEKEAAWSKFSKDINVGNVFEGRVGSVEDYGAFIHLRSPDGCYYLTGLVHVSEVSWDLVHDVRDILSEGDEVRVKITKIDRDKSRIALSIKQLEEDPLFETLDKVIPQNGSVGPNPSSTSQSYNIEPLPGLETIIEELLQEVGISDIRITRQGFEKRVVSQDLQLWLSNAPTIQEQFILLARAGRQVQEIQLTTSLDQEGIKKALQRVLERVP